MALPQPNPFQLTEIRIRMVRVSGQRYWRIEQVPEANDAPLSGHLARLAPCDLVIVEGFKHEAIDKIEVVNSALGRPRLAPDDARVVAVVADQPAGLADALPRFHRDDVDSVVAFLCERYLS